jgi:hypothetical protein
VVLGVRHDSTCGTLAPPWPKVDGVKGKTRGGTTVRIRSRSERMRVSSTLDADANPASALRATLERLLRPASSPVRNGQAQASHQASSLVNCGKKPRDPASLRRPDNQNSTYSATRVAGQPGTLVKCWKPTCCADLSRAGKCARALATQGRLLPQVSADLALNALSMLRKREIQVVISTRPILLAQSSSRLCFPGRQF